MLELHIGDKDISSGSVPISWCVSKDTLDALAKEGVTDPMIVICIAPQGNRYHIKKETRYVLPLSDLMTYISFNTAGDNKVFAFISKKGKKSATNSYLYKNDNQYISWMLNYSGEDYGGKDDLYDAKPIDVSVPDEMFAKTPFDASWVNALYSDKVVDQCHYRRRRIFSYSIQPLLYLLFAFFPKFLLTLFSILILDRGTFETAGQFSKWGSPPTFETMQGTLLYINNNINMKAPHTAFLGFLAKIIAFPLMPIFYPFYLIMFLSHHMFLLGQVALIVLGFCIAIFIVIMLAYLISSLFVEGIDILIPQWIVKLLSSLFLGKNKEPEFWYMKQDEQEAIICTGDKMNKPIALSSLPASKRTVRLHYLALKSKVCKPFSR
jgi:hypothetical protein